MKEVVYRFADGSTERVEITEEWKEILDGLSHKEMLSDRKETRRHISLEYLQEAKDFDLADPAMNTEEIALQREFNGKMQMILTEKQWVVYVKVYIEGKSYRQVARELGVYPTAVLDAGRAIIKKYLKEFEV